jgi:hypothetical protein
LEEQSWGKVAELRVETESQEAYVSASGDPWKVRVFGNGLFFSNSSGMTVWNRVRNGWTVRLPPFKTN